MVYNKLNRCILLNTTKCLFNYDKTNCIITLILTSLIKKKNIQFIPTDINTFYGYWILFSRMSFFSSHNNIPILLIYILTYKL